MTLKNFLELLIKSYPLKRAAKSNPYRVHLSILSFIKVVSIFKVRKLWCFFKKMLKKIQWIQEKNMKNTYNPSYSKYLNKKGHVNGPKK